MDSVRARGFTRRSMLASTGAVAVATASSVAAAEELIETRPRFTRMAQVREEFERLLPLWHVERKQYGLSSNTRDYWRGTHGKAIIALGPAVIPYLIQQLKAGEVFFNVPLAAITKVDITSDSLNSEQANSQQWIEWWEAGDKKPSQ